MNEIQDFQSAYLCNSLETMTAKSKFRLLVDNIMTKLFLATFESRKSYPHATNSLTDDIRMFLNSPWEIPNAEEEDVDFFRTLFHHVMTLTQDYQKRMCNEFIKWRDTVDDRASSLHPNTITHLLPIMVALNDLVSLMRFPKFTGEIENRIERSQYERSR